MHWYNEHMVRASVRNVPTVMGRVPGVSPNKM
jgi:hypothetical protein